MRQNFPTPRPHTTEMGEGRASMELLAGVQMYRGVVCVTSVCVCVGEWICQRGMCPSEREDNTLTNTSMKDQRSLMQHLNYSRFYQHVKCIRDVKIILQTAEKMLL